MVFRMPRNLFYYISFLHFAGLTASWSVPRAVLVRVGEVATLPCNWTIHRRVALSHSSNGPHIQWQTPDETVFEMKGSFRFQGSHYMGRAEMPLNNLWEGDCSLKLVEVRFSDAGLYESFIINRHKKTRSFIKSIQLKVTDHKSQQTLQFGQDFILSLHTSQGSTVIFQGSQDEEEAIKWQRGATLCCERCMEEREGVLVLRQVGFSDAGIYRVLDPNGLAISTTILTVQEADENPFESFDGEVLSKGIRVDVPLTTTVLSLLFYLSVFMCFVL